MSEGANLESALAEAAQELDRVSIPYMLIGGLALAAWALPRATLDIDLTLWVAPEDLARVCLHLCSRYIPRPAKPLEFVTKTRVLPVRTREGVRLDFIFAAFPFEKTMIERARQRQLGDATVRVASLEDLILLKLSSSRSKDQADVDLILRAYGPLMDWDYLLPMARLLGEALDQPQIAEYLQQRKTNL